MHTQTDTATVITGAGGDYLFTVKANMPALHRKLKKLLWKGMPACGEDHRPRPAGHPHNQGRSVPHWINFPDTAQSPNFAAPSPR
jgi:hypothetical protein